MAKIFEKYDKDKKGVFDRPTYAALLYEVITTNYGDGSYFLNYFNVFA
jgi:hypothetical protein